MDAQPDQRCVDHAADGCKYDALADPFIFLCTVIKSQNRLGAVGHAGNRHGDDLPDGIDDGHDPHIQIAAYLLEHGIVHNLNRAVGNGHGKAAESQTHNFQCPL